MNKALFIDRDGIVIKMCYDRQSGTVDIARCAEEVELMPGIIELLKKSKKKGYLNILISNQPQIGLKKINKKNFRKVKEKWTELLKKEKVILDGQYFCFHHPFAKILKYKKACKCRKPNPGMILQASKEFDIDLRKSWFLGDGVNDVMAGKKAGCRTILLGNIIETEYLRVIERKLKGIKPDLLVKNLREVIPHL